VVWDSTSTLPSLSAVMEPVRRELDKTPALGVLFLRLERWGDAEDLFTWRELDDAYQDLSRLVSALLGKDLRRVDLPTDLGMHGEGLAVILSAPRELPCIDLETVEAVARRLDASIGGHLADSLAPELHQRLTVQVGAATIERPAGDETLEDSVLAGLVAAEAAASQKQRRQVQVISEKIDEALTNDGLSVLYQPVYDLAAGTVAGFEAQLSGPFLLGLQHGDVLLDAADRGGLTHRLFDSYHEAAVAQAARALAPQEFMLLRVAASGLLGSAVRVMSSLYGNQGGRFGPANVIFLLEGTEVSSQLAAGLVAFRSVSEMGFRLALDLPAGCAPCLDHLRELRPDILRVSGRAVHGLAHRPDEYELLLMLSRFAGRHRMKLLAAGCSDRAEALRLRKVGVSLASGSYLAAAGPRPSRPASPSL
jgi:EAL domain-containing protein (putative c-di-GMP-specific phosphodiesterase class I)